MSNNRQRYEISICFQDRGGTKRYLNNVGTLWFDGTRGNIELRPGIALVGGDHFINVDLPRDQRQGAGVARPNQGTERRVDDDDIAF